MSDQVQVFWDPYLKTFLIGVPNRSSLPSAAPPIVVTPASYQVATTRAVTFLMDPDAPLGSPYNPIPPSPKTARSGIMYPTPASHQIPAQQSTIHPPPWPQDPTAPLGSYRNPYPYGTPLPPPIIASTPASTPPPASAPLPVPANVTYTQKQTPSFGPAWQPTADDFDKLFTTTASSKSPSPRSNPSTPILSGHSGIPNITSVYKETKVQVIASGAVDKPISHNTQPSSSPSHPHSTNPTSNSPHVHFQDQATLARAAEAAAARARQNEAEVQDYIDSNAARTLRSALRRPPTPSPTSAFQPPSAAPRRTPSPTSSTGSTIDPLLGTEAPLPAAPSRNPGFSSRSTSARSSVRNDGYERWPLCAVCGDRPETIRKRGIGFCATCFGQACAAEEVRR
ncbi:MAG: hypothetical protein Q9170_002363 [Blastenia crenularia]